MNFCPTRISSSLTVQISRLPPLCEADLEEVHKEVWVLLQVEGDCAVVHFQVGDLDSHVLEQHVLPGNGAVRDLRPHACSGVPPWHMTELHCSKWRQQCVQTLQTTQLQQNTEGSTACQSS